MTNRTDTLGQNDPTNTRDYTENTTENEEVERKGLTPINSFQNYFGVSKNAVVENLNEWSKEFGADLVNYVIKITAQRNVSNNAACSYMDSIFRSYRKNNIHTIQQAKKAEDNFKHRHSQNSNKKQRKTITQEELEERSLDF
ncbi:DnaD domain-containing protein [Fructilactobacillus fructivorans]|uniref:DnaD domain-containing protein n=1 Tax=Fructilactobacillus fructivorans TaxID=1614 RepID=UPI001ED9B501|nr:DnaD domain protein [Fructilactobacillus fructivorans]